MWQPDIKLEPTTHPAGGVAPSSYALALHRYIEKARTRVDRNGFGGRHRGPSMFRLVLGRRTSGNGSRVRDDRGLDPAA